MRLSLVVFSCILIVAVDSAVSPVRKPATGPIRNRNSSSTVSSAYAYLRRVRGTKSCTGSNCPFWQRHGRSFVSLRCYSQEYQDCTCLHRMCYRSCMFTQQVCDQEMVHCLRQICPRCTPASSASMCSVYDSMAQSVTAALSSFSCYACCPPMPSNQSSNSSNSSTSMTMTPPSGAAPVPTTTAVVPGTTTQPIGAASGTEIASSTPINGGLGNGAAAGSVDPLTENGGSNGTNGVLPNRNQRGRPVVRTTKKPAVRTTKRTGVNRRPQTTRASNNRVVKNTVTRATTKQSIKRTQATKRPTN